MSIPSLFPAEKTPGAWASRRPELLRLLAENIYGITPEISLDRVSCTLPWALELAGGIRYESRRLFFGKGDRFCSMRFELFFRPSAGPQPVILMIDVFDSSPDNLEHPELAGSMQRRLPYDLITGRGYAVALVHTNDICNDSPRTYTEGIMQIAPRQPDTGWGAIGAWAWGASRVVDYLVGDDRFDSSRIAVSGVSRAGKTALWCAAQDQRIAAILATVSGCGGASLLRGKTGEHIADMSSQFPHWTCERYAGYADREEDLPVDQHMLLALCAPRPLYLSDAIEDDWADPHKAFEAAILAEEVYRVLGRTGLCSHTFPPVHHPLLDGDIAYHVRTGGHGLLPYDWEQYLTFLDRYFLPVRG